MPCCSVQGLDDTLGLAEDSKASEAGSIRFGNVLKGPDHMAAPALPAGPTGTGILPAVPPCLQLTGCHIAHTQLVQALLYLRLEITLCTSEVVLHILTMGRCSFAGLLEFRHDLLAHTCKL